eukprot:TRINITY_DN1175_c0_g1_i5.p1 TRINITY_DN1175_c0_g1~~TRINITY_DN1175_c0_g1_i5.p1  ORF type:complete len:248 (-),score=53.53 TRINITY_DN1175_c0_g1_i5:32-775(-)
MSDHSSRFSGKVVLVTGGAGIVGSGIAKHFIYQGATVIVPSRSESRLDKLKSYIKGKESQLVAVATDIADPSGKGAEEVLKIIKEKFGGKIDHVVSSLGSWWEKGVTTKQPYEEFLNALHDFAGSHFVVAKYFLPLVANQEGSSYTIITGGAGESPLNAESGFVTIGASALFGLYLALRAEFKQSPVKLNELRIYIRIVYPEDVKQAWENPHDVVGTIVTGLAASSTTQEIIKLNSDSSKELVHKYQ